MNPGDQRNLFPAFLGALILHGLVLFGGLIILRFQPPIVPVQVTPVTLLTSADLARLTAAQLGQLDELVRRRLAGPEPEPAATAALSSGAAGPGANSVAYRRPLEIHGEISYTYGWSKAGSFQGGGLVLTYDDPAHRFSVAVGYSEFHGKGLPYCFYPGGGPYRPYAESPGPIGR